MSQTIVLESDVKRTGRVQQVEGIFDVPPSERSKVELEIPDSLSGVFDEDDWNVGLIVGPSGSGKSAVCRELWPERYVSPDDAMEWPDDRAVVDGIDAPIKEVTQMLTRVGFGSPPNWLRPYRVLSTGEQWRARLARLLLERDDPVVDEFSSVVDRQVAQFGSESVQKTVRRRGSRFVAVTCHFDVIEWLSPDWIFRPDTGQIEWPRGSLQRGPIELEVRRVSREAWSVFRPHHYLSGNLHTAAFCFGAFLDGECIAFQACYRRPHPKVKNLMAGHRTVVLPDYQGLGIGVRLKDWVAQWSANEGYRYRTTLAHPALVSSHRRSPRWTEVAGPGENKPSKSAKPKRLHKQHAQLRKLVTHTFEYVPL